MDELARSEAREPVLARYETLDELFDAVGRYGRIHVMQHADGTWSASCTLPTNPGVKSEVGSDFNTHRRPHEALRDVLEKLLREHAP